MFPLVDIQAALQEFGIDAWLLYDFRGVNPLAQRILDIDPEAVATRRFVYCIPSEGQPRKLVHRIEAGTLDHLPGEKDVYLQWQQWEAGLRRLLEGTATVAMEYSPRNANPYISRVDAGTVELVRENGAAVVSSGDLIQMFEAAWNDEQWRLHQQAADHLDAGFRRAWQFIAEQVRSSGSTDEQTVGQQLLDNFAENNLVTEHAPIVAVGPHSGDPHYETGTGSENTIREGSFVLIDQWARLDQPQAVYADFTRVAFVGEHVPEPYTNVFRIVAEARDTALNLIREAFRTGDMLEGWQVDRAARNVIEEAGYGEFFVHRTGHNIGRETHGNGAHMDDLEIHEQRRLMPRTGFSIEPGIYQPEFGIRSEINVYLDAEGAVYVTGGEPQREVLPLLAQF